MLAMHFGKKAILLLGDRYLTFPFERPGTKIGVLAWTGLEWDDSVWIPVMITGL